MSFSFEKLILTLKNVGTPDNLNLINKYEMMHDIIIKKFGVSTIKKKKRTH